jgi:alpha-tubulin suppressor-like RCC1 family protein
VVDPLLTDMSSAPATSVGRIEIKDTAGNTITNASHPMGGAAYMVLSMGENGNGATKHKTGITAACTATIADKENCDGNSVFVDVENVMANADKNTAQDDAVFWIVQDNVQAFAQFDPSTVFGGGGSGSTPPATPVFVGSTPATSINSTGVGTGSGTSGGTTTSYSAIVVNTEIEGATSTPPPPPPPPPPPSGTPPSNPAPPSPIVVLGSLVSGVHHTCYTNTTGDSWCWGSNARNLQGYGVTNANPLYTPEGILGIGNVTNQHTPQQVTTATMKFSRIIAAPTFATKHSCAISYDGYKVYCWGMGNRGQLGHGSTPASVVTTPVEVVGLPGDKIVTSLSVAGSSTLATLEDGTVWGWGSNDYGMFFDLRAAQSSAVQLDATKTGTVTVAVAMDDLDENVPSTSEVRSKNGVYCVVRTDKKLYCWGLGGNHLQSIGGGNNGVPYTGDWQGHPNGTATLLRYHYRMMPPNAQFVNVPYQVGLNNDFRNQNVVDVKATAGGICAMTEQATDNIWCFGINSQKRLGWDTSGQVRNMDIPHRLVFGAKVIDFAPGDGHSCAVTANGRVWCWGGNGSAALGRYNNHLGAGDGEFLPGNYIGTNITDAIKVTTSNFHGCAELATGVVKCWGQYKFGEFGNGIMLNTGDPADNYNPYVTIPEPVLRQWP